MIKKYLLIEIVDEEEYKDHDDLLDCRKVDIRGFELDPVHIQSIVKCGVDPSLKTEKSIYIAGELEKRGRIEYIRHMVKVPVLKQTESLFVQSMGWE